MQVGTSVLKSPTPTMLRDFIIGCIKTQQETDEYLSQFDSPGDRTMKVINGMNWVFWIRLRGGCIIGDGY